MKINHHRKWPSRDNDWDNILGQSLYIVGGVVYCMQHSCPMFLSSTENYLFKKYSALTLFHLPPPLWEKTMFYAIHLCITRMGRRWHFFWFDVGPSTFHLSLPLTHRLNTFKWSSPKSHLFVLDTSRILHFAKSPPFVNNEKLISPLPHAFKMHTYVWRRECPISDNIYMFIAINPSVDDRYHKNVNLLNFNNDGTKSLTPFVWESTWL